MTIAPHHDLNREVLRRIPLFQDLPNDALDHLLGVFTLLRCPKGRRVLEQGSPSSHALYLIRSGCAQMTVVEPECGQERLVAVLGRGDVFGETDILTGDHVTTTVEALLDSELWVLPRQDFHCVLCDHPMLAARLAILLSQRLGESNRKTVLRRTRRIIGLAGADRGEMTAFLAVNLAATLRQTTGRPVVLLDLTAEDTGLERLLGHQAIADVGEILADGLFLRPEAIVSAVRAAPQGFDVLGLRPPAEQREPSAEGLVPRLLSFLRDSHAFVLVVAGGTPEPVALKAFAQAEVVLSVTGGRWPGFGSEPGSPLVLTCEPREYAERQPAEVSLPVRASVLGRFLADGKPASESFPGSHEALGLVKLARQARGAQLGLALGSGTALGWSHVGVLEVLQRERIPIDVIAGTSMGACIGGLAAMGMTAADLTELARNVDRDRVRALFDYNLPFPRDGLIRGNQIEGLLRDLFGDTEFKDLLIPLRVVSTDLITGRRVVLKEGLVYKALRASSSIPGVLRLAEIDGRTLVDGAVSESVPAQTLRDEGVQRVVAVNCAQCPDMSERWAGRSARDFNILETLMRSTEIAMYQRNRSRDVRGDVNLNPTGTGVTWNELWRGPELIECGARAAEAALPEIRRLVAED